MFITIETCDLPGGMKQAHTINVNNITAIRPYKRTDGWADAVVGGSKKQFAAISIDRQDAPSYLTLCGYEELLVVIKAAGVQIIDLRDV
jgi:hypothetical protein